MTKITTKTLSRYKSLFTVLLALLLLVVTAAPVSALIFPNGGGNVTIGGLNQPIAITLNATSGVEGGAPTLIDGKTITISLYGTTGVTFNMTPSTIVYPTTANISLTGLTKTASGISFTVTQITNYNITNITFSGITVDVANTATATNAGQLQFMGTGAWGGPNPLYSPTKVMVTKPAISVGLQNNARLNVTAGAASVPGPAIAINSTDLHPNGEIGVGYIDVTLPSGTGITFDTSAPGVVATNTSTANTYGVGLTVTNPPTFVDAWTLRAVVTAASNSTLSYDPAGGSFGNGGQWVNFTGFKLNVASTATGSVNFTIKTTPTNGNQVSQDSMGGVAVVKPSINAFDAKGNRLLNVTAGGFHIPGGQISINSTDLHPDGEIGNQTLIRITLPSGNGITFDGSATTVAVVNTSDTNTYGVGLTLNTTIFVTDYELKVLVTKGSNSTSSWDPAAGSFGRGGQWVNFTGFKFNVSSTYSSGVWNYTIYTQSNMSLTKGTEIAQDTVSSITVTKPNVTSAGVTVALSGVDNLSVIGGQITVNSTDLSPDNEIGNQTFIRIRLPAGKGITFNGSTQNCFAVVNTSNTNTYGVGLTVSGLNVFDNGLELNVTVDKGSNSTSSWNPAAGSFGRGGQWVNFTGFKLNVTTLATPGTYNFTIYTQSNISGTLGAVIEQVVTGVTIQSAVPDTITPVDPVTGSSYNNPINIIVGTTMTFNWTVYNNGTIPYGGKLINFATNGTASWLNTSSMTSSATGNVSVQFTAPTVIPATGVTAGYNLTATANGFPLVVNTTNIKVINQTWATKLRIFPDVTMTAPGKANITVWAQDAYGNNQTSNNTVIHLSTTASDVTVLNNDQPLLGGNFTFQIYKTTGGPASLTALNYTTILPSSPAVVQNFVGDIGSIQTTSPTGKYTLVANGTDYTNLTVQLYGTDGAAMAVSGKTIGMVWQNTTTPGYGNLTVTTINAQTDSAGKAYFSAIGNSAGTIGTVWVNASITNLTPTVLRSDIQISLTGGAPSNITSGLTASQAAYAGATSTISALIKDPMGNVISGETVNFAKTTPGGSLSNSSLVTNAAGYANVTLTTNTTVGTNTVTAISATGNVSRTVDVITTAGDAAQVAVSGPSSVGVSQTGTMVAQLQDIYGNNKATFGINVNFSSSNTGAGTFPAANYSATDATGKASMTFTGTAAGGSTVITASSGTLISGEMDVSVQSVSGITMTVDKTVAATTGAITLTTQLIDSSGAKLSIAGVGMTYSNTTGYATSSPSSGITDVNGANTTIITSTTVGKPIVTAYLTGIYTGKSNTTPAITFSGNAVRFVVTATPTSTTVNRLIGVNAQAEDTEGNHALIYGGATIAGKALTFTASPTGSAWSNVSATFNSDGAAIANVTSATATTYTIGGMSDGLTSVGTTVTFTIAPIASNVGVFRDGVFYLNGDGYMVYGLSTDTPIIGNWDGTGDDAGVWRNNLTTGSSVFYRDGADAIAYGIATDTPIVGDWNGDRKSEIGVWRSSATAFYLRNIDGTTTTVVFGLPTDIPVIGDWNGDLISEVGVYRDGVFYLNGAGYTVYGVAGDEPIIGDWNGDLISEVGVWRNNLGSVFYRNGATVIPYGLPTDTPVIGRWA